MHIQAQINATMIQILQMRYVIHLPFTKTNTPYRIYQLDIFSTFHVSLTNDILIMIHPPMTKVFSMRG